MQALFIVLSMLASLVATPALAETQSRTLSVTVSFRERIALPPGAQLDLQLRRVVSPDEQTDVLASRRFAIGAVPMTVSLGYDPRVVNGDSDYAVFAAIRSPDGQHLFRETAILDIASDPAPVSADIMLKMVPRTAANASVQRRISGVAWTVTEVFGEAWPNDDPATLMIDEGMNVSAYGGCNRFRGQIKPSVLGLALPETLAGTMMACPDETEAQERRFLAALAQVADYVRYGAGLVMIDAQGRAVLHFIETPE